MVRCINANTMNGQWMKDCLNDENYIETLTSNCFPVFPSSVSLSTTRREGKPV